VVAPKAHLNANKSISSSNFVHLFMTFIENSLEKASYCFNTVSMVSQYSIEIYCCTIATIYFQCKCNYVNPSLKQYCSIPTIYFQYYIVKPLKQYWNNGRLFPDEYLKLWWIFEISKLHPNLKNIDFGDFIHFVSLLFHCKGSHPENHVRFCLNCAKKKSLLVLYIHVEESFQT